jgi:hypothetical protein
VDVKKIEKEITTAMKANLMINDQRIEVIIDSGAGPNVISNKLRQELDIPINSKSSERCTLANGQTIASLGKALVYLTINDNLEIPIVTEVIDSRAKEMIIGNDALGEWNAIIDYKDQVLWINYESKDIKIPINYIREIEDSDDDEDYEIEPEYDYEEGDKRKLYTVIRNDEETIDEAKEIVLASYEERH